MTKEEIEEGCYYLKAFDEHPSRGELRAIHTWLEQHASELLTLAEEARWRSVEEEPPSALEQVFVDAHVDELPIAYMDPHGLWFNAHEQLLVTAPTHWRPLPKGPEP